MKVDIKMNHVITPDDIKYYQWVDAVLKYIDPEAKLQIRENDKQLIIHITPSDGELRQSIIEGLLNIHHKMETKIEFSKSLAISKKISYFVNKTENIGKYI